MKLYDDLIIEFRDKKNDDLDKEKNKNKILLKSKNINEIELEIYFLSIKDLKIILNNINLKACKGDLIGIAGRSGSGKSTLLNIIAD